MGLIVKWPPLSLSKIRQNTDGESKYGLESYQPLVGEFLVEY